MGAPIMILDELDSGVGGRLGQPVAAMLRRMAAAPAAGEPAAAAQILCVSHLPQARLTSEALHHLSRHLSCGVSNCWGKRCRTW